jgi:hypothetical protein
MKRKWIVYDSSNSLMMGEIVAVVGGSFAIRFESNWTSRRKEDRQQDRQQGSSDGHIKLKSIADITETEHFIFGTKTECVAFGEHWEAQMSTLSSKSGRSYLKRDRVS